MQKKEAASDAGAQAELAAQPKPRALMPLRLPLSVCVPIIAALSLCGWILIALVFRLFH